MSANPQQTPHRQSALIRLRGVRQNNLKSVDLDLPHGRLLVFTGVSGSGKSSLAFDTLYAEGQRRFIETFSPYARQFFDRMDKPAADLIEGIPPAIAIEQRNTVRTTRSTVGTMTEIGDYARLVWFHLAQLHCRKCGRVVRKESPTQIWVEIARQNNIEDPHASGHERRSSRREETPLSGATNQSLLTSTATRFMEKRPDGPMISVEVLVTFTLPLSAKLSLKESLQLVNKQGYQRLLWVDQEPGAGEAREGAISRPAKASPGIGRVIRVDAAAEYFKATVPASLTIIQDRMHLAKSNRARFVEACEQAYHFGQGRLAIHHLGPGSTMDHLVLSSRQAFSCHRHCAECDLEYAEPSPALFSFNHPIGACPTCRGFGRIIGIDYRRVMPDQSKTLAVGVVRPWRSGFSAECQDDLMKFCKLRGVPTDVPFDQLPRRWQDWVVQGDPDYGQDPRHEWPHAWYGVKGYFRWLESKSYKMHVRVLLSRYRAYSTCPDCGGRRFQPESLLYRLTVGAPREDAPATVSNALSLSLADFYRMPIQESLTLTQRIAEQYRQPAKDPLGLALEEIRSRLHYLVEAGLGYLTLDRPTRTLSGGETERVNLTACLGTRLVNTLYVLDEPTVGLHPRDTERLVRIMERLRDMGNTVVVVEHEARVIKAADQIVDLGPRAGEAGGRVVFHGSLKDLLASPVSLTGQYLSGRRQVPVPQRRAVAQVRKAEANHGGLHEPKLRMQHLSGNNLQDLEVEIPLQRLVCVTGVSGSGKTTLVREVLWPMMQAKLRVEEAGALSEDETAESNSEALDCAASECQPVVSGGEQVGRVIMVDQSSLGKTPRSNPCVYVGAFDDLREIFALTEQAQQRGLNASAFNFNSVQGQCERCHGVGFEKIEMQFLSDVFVRCPDCQGRRYRPHVLEIKLKPAELIGADNVSSSSADREWSISDLLEATVNEVVALLTELETLGAARRARVRLQLLQEVGLGYLRIGQPINTLSGGESQRLKLVRYLSECSAPSGANDKPSLFLLDEPTTGLHFDDVQVLLQVFHRLVDAGHSVVVVEHNLEVIKNADWVIDLGPEAGAGGGRIVVQGTPEKIARCTSSHTGRALKEVLEARY
jgi:excinuclease ABC subunit A